DDLIAGLAASLLLAEVAVTERRAAQDIDRAPPRRMAFAPSAALEDLGPLVLSDHALHLQQQVFLRGTADGVVEEDNFYPPALKLIDQEYLIGIFPGQAIGRVDIESINGPGGHLVPQALQGRTDQGAPTVALIDETQLGFEAEPVAFDPLFQGRELAGDGVVLGLLFGRNAGIQGRPQAFGLHRYPPVEKGCWGWDEFRHGMSWPEGSCRPEAGFPGGIRIS